MIKKKRMTAGFVLSIIGAIGVFGYPMAWILSILVSSISSVGDGFEIDGMALFLHNTAGNLMFCLAQFGIALSIILLSVYGKKGGRAELIGLLVVSILALFLLYCFATSIFSLIGSILMLSALPKKRLAENTAVPSDEIAPESAQDEQAETSSETAEGGHAPTESALTEGKTVVKKQNGFFQKFRKKCRKLGAGTKKLRARMCDEHASKLPAFLVLTVLFLAAFIAYSATYFRDVFLRAFDFNGILMNSNDDLAESLPPFIDFIYTISVFFRELFTPRILWHAGAGYWGYYTNSLTGDILPQLIFALLPIYLVYLGTHNPLRLPKGYAALLAMLGALCFAQIDLMVIYNSVACAELYLAGSDAALGYLVYLLLASVICTQVATLFLFPYFLGEKTSSKAAIGFVLASALLLPLLIALIVAAVIAVLVIALFVLFVVFILSLVLWLLRVESDAGDSFAGAILGKSVEMKEYTFTTDMGTSMTVYSQDGRKFYSANGAYIGHSEDGGKTILRD